MNKIVLITGASRGIGAQTALLAGQKGYDVCINYREDKQAAEARAIMWLLSDEASYTTGSFIDVAGGR